jgi:hypothetical protein
MVAIVYGAVTTAAGGPAAGVRVFGFARYPDCTGSPVGGSDFVTSDAAGRYRLQIREIARPARMCTEVVVVPGAGGVADTVRTSGPALEFRIPARAAFLDSGRVDVRLP